MKRNGKLGDKTLKLLGGRMLNVDQGGDWISEDDKKGQVSQRRKVEGIKEQGSDGSKRKMSGRENKQMQENGGKLWLVCHCQHVPLCSWMQMQRRGQKPKQMRAE